jgi:hypothetical protein
MMRPTSKAKRRQEKKNKTWHIYSFTDINTSDILFHDHIQEN